MAFSVAGEEIASGLFAAGQSAGFAVASETIWSGCAGAGVIAQLASNSATAALDFPRTIQPLQPTIVNVLNRVAYLRREIKQQGMACCELSGNQCGNDAQLARIGATVASRKRGGLWHVHPGPKSLLARTHRFANDQDCRPVRDIGACRNR